MGLYLQDPTIKDLEKRFGDNAHEYYETYIEFVKKILLIEVKRFLEFL